MSILSTSMSCGAFERVAHVADVAAEREEGLAPPWLPWRLRVRMMPASPKIAAIGACGLRTVMFTALIFGKAGQNRLAQHRRRPLRSADNCAG